MRINTNRKIKILLILVALASLWITKHTYCQQPTIRVVTIDNYIINPVTDEYIASAIDQAENDGAECLIIQLDTPGGLLESTRRIVKNIMNANVPVVVYIAPQGSRAGSAGVFITLAAHVASMSPSTNIGAAHPVSVSGKKEKSMPEAISEFLEYIKNKDKPKNRDKNPEKKTEPMEDKILNDTIAWITTIAEQRNRNVEWAKKAVLESVSATETEALKLSIVDFIAENLDELKIKLHGLKIKTVNNKHTLNTKNARFEFINLTTRQRILNTITNPTIAYILMMLGFYGLLFEVTHPGFGFPGIAGTICIILAFYSFQALPINYAGLALIILAILLFIAEAFTPTFGLLTMGGIVSMALGSLMLIDSPYEFMRVSLTVILPFVLATALVTIFLVTLVARTRRKKTKSGKEALIDAIAVARTDFKNGEGKVFTHGEIWSAKSKQNIKKGAEVKVVKIEGLMLTVKRGHDLASDSEAKS